MSKRVELSSVDYKRTMRVRREAQQMAPAAQGNDLKVAEQSGQILLAQVNTLMKSTTFRKKDFASRLQSKGIAWSPGSETLRKTSNRPPAYSQTDLINTYFYTLKYTILAAVEPRLKTPDQSIFEFLNDEFKKWDRDVFSSKAFLSSDEVKILLQCMKIHAGYIQSRLDLESSEVFIPLSLVKVVKAEDITFSDVLETVLVNETEKCQKTPEIKEYVVSKIKYIMFLASFDFALTKRVFELSSIFSVDQKTFEDALMYSLISATPHCTLAEVLQRRALIETHPSFTATEFPSPDEYSKWKAFEEASSQSESKEITKKMSSSQINSIGVICVRVLTLRYHSEKATFTVCEISANGSSRKTRQALGTREEPFWGDHVSFLINSVKPGKKSKDKKESTVKLTVKVYGRTKLIEKALYSAKIKLNVGSQFVHKAEWVPLGDKPKKGDPEVYVDYSVVLFPTKLSPVPRPNLMYRILLQRLHEHEVSTHPAFNCGLLCEGAAKTSDGSGTFDVPLYTEDLRRLVRDCLSHYGITRLSPLLNLGLFHDIIAVDMSKDVISSIQRQLDGIVKTKEIYTTKELGFLKASLAGLQDVCRLSMGKFTFVFPDDEKSGDESEAKRREMLETLDMFMGLFKRIEVMNGTSDTSSVFAKCLHENSEFALAVITDNVSGKERKLTECSSLARTVNGLAGYLRKLSVYSPVFSKYVKFYEPYCSLFSAFYEKTVVPFMVKENANKRGSYSATPLEFLMLYKRSTDLFKALKECGWTKPLPLIGELFVHHIVGWIWDCDEQFTKWNQRIIESETWTPISEDVYYSHSIIDIITYMSTAKEELAGLCFGVEEGPAAAGKYAEEIWKAYSLLLAKTAFGYSDLLNERFLGFMPKVTNLPSPKLMDKENTTTVTKYIKFSCLCISNYEACASFLNDYTDEMTEYLTSKDGPGLPEDARLIYDINSIVDDVFVDIGKKTVALTEELGRLTESMLFTLIKLDLLGIQSEQPIVVEPSAKSGPRRLMRKFKTTVKKNLLAQQISSEYDTPDGGQIKSSLKDSLGAIIPSAPSSLAQMPRRRVSMQMFQGKSLGENDPVCEYLDFYLEVFADSLQQVTFKKVLRKFWAACVKAMEVVALGSHGRGLGIGKQPSFIEFISVLVEFFDGGGDGLKKEVTSPDVDYLKCIIQFAPFETEKIVEFGELKPGTASEKAVRAILIARGYS